MKDDLMGEALQREDANDEGEEGEYADLEARRKDDGGREDADDEDEEKEPRRIAFSRDRDLQRYRSVTRSAKSGRKPYR